MPEQICHREDVICLYFDSISSQKTLKWCNQLWYDVFLNPRYADFKSLQHDCTCEINAHARQYTFTLTVKASKFLWGCQLQTEAK